VILVNWTRIQVFVCVTVNLCVSEIEWVWKCVWGVGVVQWCGWGCVLLCGLSWIYPATFYIHEHLPSCTRWVLQCCSTTLCPRRRMRSKRNTIFGWKKNTPKIG
jgi:hypothetical protein